MFVSLGNEQIEVIVINKNNKNIYFRFQDDLKLYVTCSRFISKKEIIKLITKNEDKLLKMYKQQLKENTASIYFNYLGKKYIKVTNPELKNVFIEEEYIYFPSEKKLEKFYKDECLRIFKEEIAKCSSSFTGLPKFNLKIRYMKTRWGVCNRSNNVITLNSELLKKEIDLIDYVIIHELCHFYEGNHSKNFWTLVEKQYPKYKEARKRLKEV